MNRFIKTTILLLSIALASCEDVIDVPVQTGPTRLVVEASLDWEKGTAGNEQSIRLSNSTAFFDTTSNTAVTGASVKVTNDSSGAEFVFADLNTGEYATSSFVPVIGQSYTLEIIHNGETYSAQETLMGVPDITELFQDTADGFDDEILEAHIVFTDPPEEGNYYFFRFEKQGELLPDFEVGDDEFVNGNEVDWWYEIEEADDENDVRQPFAAGDVLDIDMYGISEAYNNYITILIDQIGGVGIFEATPVSVKGNCINLTNPDNYAQGYFRLTEFNRTSYTFE
ncbi:DUF4249 domain-containing protein [Maribacter algarum]|uniref:DUF4249 domain-containing protein n=1 Tax=Maribacter algarum (ex Zhang et al. 2020) TaxID=2578118 RepID=A0A5S3PRT7_9FLAO|nr:DUF4249 domain-containing protein [Maribacter algarum]TMM57394.1 DUF4249 domain-containing protein [Maribacter algarum]